MVIDRKEYLERKIAMLVGEREGLSCNLDETSEKIIVLERHNREQETKVSARETLNYPGLFFDRKTIDYPLEMSQCRNPQ